MKLRNLLLCMAVGASSVCFAEAPKYVFLFIGDGMGMGHVSITEAYLRDKNEEGLLMTSFPVASMSTTHSASSRVTDSAASGTAIATGQKTRNWMIGMNPDTVPIYSFAKNLKEQGYGIGIGTTCAPDDATPAAFYAHVPNRYMQYEIGKDLAESGFDFIAGADLRGVKKDGKATNLLDILRKSGYDIVRGEEAARNSSSPKVIMLNTDKKNNNNIGFTIDSVAGVLTLPQVTQVTLDHLLKYSPEKFFMMIENGNIDYSSHADDGGAIIREVQNLDESIAIAYEFYKQHPDETLIIVTADHNTGGVANGNVRLVPNTFLTYTDFRKIHKNTFADLKNNPTDWEGMKKLLSEKTGLWSHIEVTAEEEAKLLAQFNKLLAGKSKIKETWYHNFNEFTDEVFNLLNAKSGIYFTSDTHTGDYVPVFAIGVGADRFKSITDNTQISKKIMNAK